MFDASQIPAFPVPASAVHQGVSLRDWFAANALQGIIAKGLEVQGDRALTQKDKDMEMVRRAFSLADEMIKMCKPLPSMPTAKPTAKPIAKPISTSKASPSAKSAATPQRLAPPASS